MLNCLVISMLECLDANKIFVFVFEYHAMCLARDISVRQRSKSEHWASYHVKTPSLNDLNIVESDVNPD